MSSVGLASNDAGDECRSCWLADVNKELLLGAEKAIWVLDFPARPGDGDVLLAGNAVADVGVSLAKESVGVLSSDVRADDMNGDSWSRLMNASAALAGEGCSFG